MSDEKETLSRRRALKVIGVGAGTVGALSLYGNPVFGQHEHMHDGSKAHAAAAAPEAPRYFTAAEMATIAALTDLIIPSDDHSPGAKEAGVPAFVDLMVSSSPEEVRTSWRDGLAVLDAASERANGKRFSEAPEAAQVALLREISRNEMDPKTPEERFFRAAKGLTIDGYYTSEIGIHKDLEYKGNSYNKTFVGCTHPEHKG